MHGVELELDFTHKKSHQCAQRLFCSANQISGDEQDSIHGTLVS